MSGEPIRRPIRAFLLTPPIFSGIFVLAFVVPEFVSQLAEVGTNYTFDDYMLAYSMSVLFFVSATIISYLAITIAIPIYFAVRKGGKERAWMPVFLGPF